MATTKTINVTNQTVSVPEFTERPDARVFSDAEGKCVDGINANTQAIANLNMQRVGTTTFTSQSALETALVTLGGDMADGDFRNIRFGVGSGGAGVLPQQGYTGVIHRYASGRYNILIQSFGNAADTYTANYRNSAWTWGKLDVVDNKTATITAHTGVTGLTIQLSMRQSGKIVSINGYVTGVSVSANTGVELLDFSGVDAPATNQDVRFTGTIADAAWLPGTQVYVIITSTNKIQINSPSTVSNKVLYFNATYIVV